MAFRPKERCRTTGIERQYRILALEQIGVDTGLADLVLDHGDQLVAGEVELNELVEERSPCRPRESRSGPPARRLSAASSSAPGASTPAATRSSW